MRLKSISPVIAIIILVAVTIAIAVAVAGWMMGLWTGFTAKPALSITDAVLYVNESGGKLTAIVQNSGQGDAVIYSIKIGNAECALGNKLSLSISSIKRTFNSTDTIKAGDTVKLTAKCEDWNSNRFTPGTSEQIVIFTRDGSKFVGTVQIVSAPSSSSGGSSGGGSSGSSGGSSGSSGGGGT